MSLLTSIIIVNLNGSFIVMLKLEQSGDRSLYVIALVFLITLRYITTQLLLLVFQLGVYQH